jgi:hypothetical protein
VDDQAASDDKHRRLIGCFRWARRVRSTL